ncbi:glutaminase [Gordonia sp. (in: high G+C Gram-positive bacteria)]|uniref:glutaminase n=1 Tax=Gordonia sp. (in: high G+C Gram-positive bacteria) TaxID=84139 RepID=UPI001693F00C|nr:glutaminase [Gordonia sp. (in: high G+C Gram-positive bacteria)]NLG45256.1 glutaminase [Gordonia sp. (in: high G+C Gram-positive bacteria)]
MRSPIPDYLAEALRSVESDQSGATADYIPELADADPDRLAVAFCTEDGRLYSGGDRDTEFTIQSISKPFVYALALADRGFDEVLEKVNVEPSGDAFNDVSFEAETGRPRNPMINAGAITAHTLAGERGAALEQRSERIVEGLSAFAGRRLSADDAVYASEIGTAFRNRALANMLRANGIIDEDPLIAVSGYTRQCSLLVTVEDLALMAATLANRGVNPRTGEQVVSAVVVRQTLSVMATCGMYDGAGDWMTRVGIPAKSGVAGGLIGALPGQAGIATFSPRLDRHGNSVRGVNLFQRFTSDMGMHVMEMPPPGPSVIRSRRVFGHGSLSLEVVALQGGIRFAGAERVLRDLEESPPAHRRVAFSMGRVTTIGDVARRMLLEAVRRLTLDGHDVYLIDPDRVLPDPEPGTGGRVTVVRHREDI